MTDPTAAGRRFRPLVALGLLAAAILAAGTPGRAASVPETVLFHEMGFVEEVAEQGYFELARTARDRAKEIPDLTQAQRAFLDLVRAKINTQEILDTKDLSVRPEKLEAAVSYLDDVAAKLPPGSDLKIAAEARKMMTYIAVAEGYLKELDRLDMDIRGGVGDVEKLKERRQAVHEMALGICNKIAATTGTDVGGGEAGSRPPVRQVQDAYWDLFYKLLNAASEIAERRLQAIYWQKLESIFMQIVQYERRVAGLYVAYARLYPRESKERRRIFEEGYWFTMDIDEMHSEYLSVNYFTPMNFIRLAGLTDQPLPEEKTEEGETVEVKSLLGRIPQPAVLLSKTFSESVVGEHPRQAVAEGQGDRPKCLFFYALSWLRLARGAYRNHDEAVKNKQPQLAERYLAQAEKMLGECENALSEIQKGATSLVGPVPDFIPPKAQLEIRVPLLLLKADRSLADGNKAAAADYLGQAGQICNDLIMQPDPAWRDDAQKHMLVVDTMLEDNGLEGIEYPGKIIAEADRTYKQYINLKNRRPRNRTARAEWEQQIDDLLLDMREKYRKAITLLRESDTMDRRLRADYTAKSWYNVGLASLYLEDYYEAYIANQHVLQVFPVEDYPSAAYPGVERYRRFASKNVLAAGARQKRRTAEATGRVLPFDGKLYAWSLIWKIRYEAQRAAEIGEQMETGTGAEDMVQVRGQVRDFWWAVGREFERIGRYRDAYDWYAKSPEDHRLYRLAHLKRGQVSLKKAQDLWNEVERQQRLVERLAAGEVEMEVKEAEQQLDEVTAEAETWTTRAEAHARRFIELIGEHRQQYPDLDALPRTMEPHRELIRQERNVLYAGYLLLMQSRFNAEDYAAVRRLAPEFYELDFEVENRGEIVSKAGYMHLVSLIEPRDWEAEPVAELKAVLDACEPVHQRILEAIGPQDLAATAEAESENMVPLQASLLLGQKWLQVAGRLREDQPQVYDEYREIAGRKFEGAISVVRRHLKFGVMVGTIFSDMELYDRAERVFDLALEVWDTPERQQANQLPDRAALAGKVRQASTFYTIHAGQEGGAEMKTLFLELAEQVAPQEGRPNYYGARVTIRAIREKHAEYVRAHPENTLLKKGSPDLQPWLAQLDEALDYQYDILSAQQKLVLAKVDLHKWDEALALLDRVLEVDPTSSEFQELRGEVYVSRAEAAETWDEQTRQDVAQATEIAKNLTVVRDSPYRARKYGMTWWEGLAINYRAQAVSYIFRKDEPAPADDGTGAKPKSVSEQASQLMKHIRMWQTNVRAKPPEAFNEQMDRVYDRLTLAGFQELSLPEEEVERLNKLAEERLAEAREREKAREAQEKRKRAQLMGYMRENPDEVPDYFDANPDEIAAFYEEFPEDMKRFLGEEALREAGVLEPVGGEDAVEPVEPAEPGQADEPGGPAAPAGEEAPAAGETPAEEEAAPAATPAAAGE